MCGGRREGWALIRYIYIMECFTLYSVQTAWINLPQVSAQSTVNIPMENRVIVLDINFQSIVSLAYYQTSGDQSYDVLCWLRMVKVAVPASDFPNSAHHNHVRSWPSDSRFGEPGASLDGACTLS